MSALAELQRRIESTNALIAEHERALADPKRKHAGILAPNIRSLEKLRRRLEAEFQEEAAHQALEVYRYRLLEADEERPKLSAVGDAWVKFQEFFAEVYRALVKGEKVKRRAPELEYAYSFPGSVGVVVTVPHEYTNLAGYSALDDASKVLFDFIEAKNIPELTRRLGPAPIKALNCWVETLLDNRLGIGLDWSPQKGAGRSAEVQYQQLQTLRTEIVNTTTESESVITGELVMVDTQDGSFRLVDDSGESYQGAIGSAITMEHAASVPARYVARILKTSKIIVVGEEPKTTFSLLELDAVPPASTRSRERGGE